MKVGTDILTGAGFVQARSLGGRKSAVLLTAFAAFLFLFVQTLRLGLSGGARSVRAAAGAVSPQRADIVDRNGEILAKNIYTYDLFVNPRQMKKPDDAALFVHSVIPDIPAAMVLSKINNRKYTLLRQNIPHDAARKIRDEGIDGIVVVSRQVRKYPMRNSAAHIVGFINQNGDGLGVEFFENERLEKDTAPLQLSLDSRVQSIMWTELSAAMSEYGARAAVGILINARTGEIISVVSLPDFDPENIGDYKLEAQRFRAMRDTYEIGSIFKIFNTALALSFGIPATQPFDITEPPVWNGRVIETREAGGFKPPHDRLTVEQIMQYSSNIGSAKIALSLPDGAQMDFFRELGFAAPLRTDFGASARTLLPGSQTPTDRSRWAFGQGIAVTPMHALLAANAIANDGKYITPTIFKRQFVPSGAARQVAPLEVSRKVRGILYSTRDTSARLAANQIQGIDIGGKTSTAQKVVNGKYSKELTAFFATFPIQTPKYSMLVLFDEPAKYPRTAAFNAVPTAGKILDAVIPLLM
ncbi:MAG: penicillin-binding protein 2 [Rickettsiales bacterium]|jgi:cell division protein FtsI (penicillin-binding protein 3)|nr:penicillin-binding protein 2 [Rickettsiales bacterium]